MGEPVGTHPALRVGPLRFVAYAMIAGIVLGRALPQAAMWLLLAATIVVIALAWLVRDKRRAAGHWALLGVVALSAAWHVLRVEHTSERDLVRYVSAEPQLAEVVGVVDGPPWLRAYDAGAFGPFNWEPPATLFPLRVETIVVRGVPTPAHGHLLVRIAKADPRVHEGQRVRCTGWLSTIDGPLNPGDRDYAAALAERGIAGRLSLPGLGNYERLADPPLTPMLALQRLRWACARAADESLSLGLLDEPLRLGLLRTLLLGQRSGDLKEVRDQFTRVGLAHILSISGAHLVILMTLVVGVARLVIPRPSRAAALALVVLLVYLMAIPAYVPIIRAGIASGIFLLGFASGRRVSALDLLALATIVVLAWRPMDLFAPGFQLSFGGVLALLLWTKPVARWMWPEPAIAVAPAWWEGAARYAVEACAASIVAFALTLPIVAYHFGMVSPLAALLSVLALVPVTLLLWVGYAKILLGVFVPSLSYMLSLPVAWFTDMLLSLVAEASTWPGAAWELAAPPTIVWTAGAMLAVAALLSGAFARRRAATCCVGAVVMLWLAAPEWGPMLPFRPPPPVATVTMVAVGDGSCFLVQTHAPGREHTLMFDCGSGAYLDVGERSVVPTLAKLGVTRIDTLAISHADLDHFSGVLDVVDALPVGRVLVPPQLLREAAEDPGGSTAFLIAELRNRDLVMEEVSRGHAERMGDAEVDVLWPPRDYFSDRSNDNSLAFSLRVGGQRVLLNGDLAQDATASLLAAGEDLRADVTDLPHHGAFVDASPAWFAAVSPQVVLQSSGHARLRDDKWAAIVQSSAASRYVTAHVGMTQVFIDNDGRIRVETFRDEAVGGDVRVSPLPRPGR